MKKILALVLALCMIFALCACGSTAAAPAAESAETASADSSAEASAVAVKAGLICLHDENSGYDKNFIDAFKAACDDCGVEYMIKTNIPEANEAYDAACELADDGCTVIFADSYGHQDFILQAAQEYPEVNFTSCTGDKAQSAGLENYHNAFATIYQGRYLAGIAAGMKLNEMIEAGEFTADEAKIGYVGAMAYAEVKSGYTSFFLGARSVCPTATMDVVFTGSWFDETLENEGATKLIANGCKLISQHADSMGAPNACESAGVPNVSYNGSTQTACPNTYIISSRINWQPYFTYAISAVQAGENYDIDWCGSLDDESVLLTDLNEDVAAEGTAEAIAKAAEELKAGTLNVFDCSTWTVDGETLTSYDKAGYYEGNECIWDGYFHESETRSAPYFDLTIDGVTLLDQ